MPVRVYFLFSTIDLLVIVHWGGGDMTVRYLRVLTITAILAVTCGPLQSEENSEFSAAKQKLKDAFQDRAAKKKEDWQTVKIPPNLDGTVYAYDKNSITPIKRGPGEFNAVELAVVVIRGDESILGKHALFTFFCDGTGRYRINHSYPLSTRSQLPTQEDQLENIACVARCKGNGEPICRSQ
jgi:hypothetical protein